MKRLLNELIKTRAVWLGLALFLVIDALLAIQIEMAVVATEFLFSAGCVAINLALSVVSLYVKSDN